MHTVKILSFGFKHGIPKTPHQVDARDLPNPHNVRPLRNLTGRDPEVKNWLREKPQTAAVVEELVAMARQNSLVAIGCYGGRHRSVAVAEMAAEQLRLEGVEVEIEHSALEGTDATA